MAEVYLLGARRWSPHVHTTLTCSAFDFRHFLIPSTLTEATDLHASREDVALPFLPFTGPCFACWGFFLVGWFFTFAFISEVGVFFTNGHGSFFEQL